MSSVVTKWKDSVFLSYLFIHSLILNVDSCIRLRTIHENKPWEPLPKSDIWWQKMHQDFVQNSKTDAEGIDILLYGDSITRGWSQDGISTFNKHYAPLGAANYGINADRTEHLLWRIQNDEVRNIHPRVIVLMIGTNNMAYSTDLDIARGIFAIVLELRIRLPKSKILVVGILPKSNNVILMGRVFAINHFLEMLDDGSMIRYLDMKEHFYMQNGILRKELYQPDLLHLSAKGYAKWAEVMDPLLTEMLKLN